MTTENTGSGSDDLQLRDVLEVETGEGKRLEFEVVGLVESEIDHERYAVVYCEKEDTFAVVHMNGELLEDDELAQEILDDFFELAAKNGGD